MAERDTVYITSDQPVPHPTRFPDTGVVASYRSLAAGRIVSNDYPDDDVTPEAQNDLTNCSYL